MVDCEAYWYIDLFRSFMKIPTRQILDEVQLANISESKYAFNLLLLKCFKASSVFYKFERGSSLHFITSEKKAALGEARKIKYVIYWFYVLAARPGTG